METLFNIDFETIDKDVLIENLLGSTLESKTAEDNIVEAIERSQKRQERFLSTGWGYFEGLWKYSTPTISIPIYQAVIYNYPTLISNEISISPTGSNAISGLMTRGAIIPSFSSFLWRLYDVVYLENNLYSTTAISGNIDIMATVESKEYYFLKDLPGETIYGCSVAPLTQVISFVSDDRVLNFSDANSFYFGQSDVINIDNKVLHNNEMKISRNQIIDNNITVANNILLIGAQSTSGAINKKMIESFLLISDGVVANSAAIQEETEGNCMPVLLASNTAKEQKAPFEEWKTNELTKITIKDTTFLHDFVDILLSGDSIPEGRLEEFSSVVSKVEIDNILGILADAIVNMDICDDN